MQSLATPRAPSKYPASSRFTVVVGLDFTDADGPAFDQAARLVTHVPGGAMHLVHVFGTAPSAERSRDLISHLRLYVNEKSAASTPLRGVAVGIHVRGGKPVRELVQLATEVAADLIVVGSHAGPHVRDWLEGSTVARLVAAGGFPVLVAGAKHVASEAHDPKIEPACPDCVAARMASSGSTWWCERHAHAARAGHTYSYEREIPLTEHDSEVIPTGIDF